MFLTKISIDHGCHDPSNGVIYSRMKSDVTYGLDHTLGTDEGATQDFMDDLLKDLVAFVRPRAGGKKELEDRTW